MRDRAAVVLVAVCVLIAGVLATVGVGGASAQSPTPSGGLSGLSASGAVSVFDQDVAAHLPDAVASSVQPLAGRTVLGYVGDNRAVVTAAGGGTQTAVSLLPLRTTNADGTLAPVDLSLRQQDDGTFVPANALVKGVQLPASASGAVDAGDGVSLTLSGSSGASGQSASDDSIVYPNISTDSDLVAQPLMTGAEIAWVLRSASSPTEQTFELSIPSGDSAALNDTGDVVVTSGSRQTVAVVSAPTARDASGARVPASYSLSGDQLTVSVTLPASVSYPVLVDPTVWVVWVGSNEDPPVDGFGSGVTDGPWTSYDDTDDSDFEFGNYGSGHEQDDGAGPLYIWGPPSYTDDGLASGSGLQDPGLYSWVTGDTGDAYGEWIYTPPPGTYITDGEFSGETDVYDDSDDVWYGAFGLWSDTDDALTDETDTLGSTYNYFGESVSTSDTTSDAAVMALVEPGNEADGALVLYDATFYLSSTDPVNIDPPTITTGPQTLTASPGTWTSSTSLSYTYQWERCHLDGSDCSDVSGATAATYTLGIADVDSDLEVVVTATNTDASDSATSATVTADPPPAGTIQTVAGTGTAGDSGDGGLATSATLDVAEESDGVATDAQGDLFIADAGNDTVREVNARTGVISTVAGDGSAGYSGDGGPATSAKLDDPEGLAVDSSGDLFISDTYNDVVREVDASTGDISTVAGGGTDGYGDGGPATDAGLALPDGLALDSSGDLFIADTADSAIREVHAGTGTITTVAGSFTDGFSGDGGSATSAKLDWPAAVAVDSSGDLFIADTENQRIREVNHTTGDISTIAGNGLSGEQAAYTGPATGAEIGYPYGLARDSQGNLYITDGYDDVLKITEPSGDISDVAGLGSAGYSGDGTPAVAAKLDSDSGLALDPGGDLFVLDGGNDVVREVYDLASTPLGGDVSTSEAPGCGNASESAAGCDDIGGVDTRNGDYSTTLSDFSIPGRGMAIDLTQTYNSANASQDGPLGYGWSFSYGMSLSAPSSTATITQEDGSQIVFNEVDGDWIAAPRVHATLTHNGDGTWTLVRGATATYTFNSAGELLSETDLNGYSTDLHYGGEGCTSTQLCNVEDVGSRELLFTYNDDGTIATITEPAITPYSANYVHFGYTSGNLTSWTDAGGNITSFTYYGGHQLETILDPDQYGSDDPHYFTLDYDDSGRVTSETTPEERETSFDYTSVAGATKITDPRSIVTLDYYQDGQLSEQVAAEGTDLQADTSYVYDPVNLGPVALSDADGHDTGTAYDQSGNPLIDTNGLGQMTTATYNSMNEPLTTTDAMGVETTNTYDASGNIMSTSSPTGEASPNDTALTTYSYDAGEDTNAGDLTGITDPDQNISNAAHDGSTNTFTYQYGDAYGDVTSQTDAVNSETSYAFNILGQETSSLSPDGNALDDPTGYTTTYTPDAFGRDTSTEDPNANIVSTAYDADGNVHSTTDGGSHVTIYSYNLDNEQTATTLDDGSTNLTVYDADGNVTSQTIGETATSDGATDSYTYDDLNHLASKTDPDERTTHYTYDAVGNLVSETNPDDQTTTYSYDAANRLTGISYTDGTHAVSYSYNANGQPTSMTDGTGTSSWSWYEAGELKSYTNGDSSTVGYTWTASGNLASITYPNDETVTRTYWPDNQLKTVTDWLSHTTTFHDDGDGPVNEIDYPNGITSTLGYDHADRLKTIDDTQDGATNFSFHYTYNNNNHITAETDGGTIGTPGPTSDSYDYNGVNELTDTETDDPDPFAYDSTRNITAQPVLTESDDVWSHTGRTYQAYDDASQLCWSNGSTTGSCDSPPSGATSYAYNNEGDRTAADPPSAGDSSYSYNQVNELTGYSHGDTTASYAYDGDGLRESKTVDDTTEQYTWDQSGSLPLMLVDGDDNYIYGPGDVPIEQIDGTTVDYYLQDALGSTRVLTDSSGDKIASYTYGAYGQTLATTGTSTVLASNPIDYAGQYTDHETGFVYLRARYYDPATGQFLTVDPAVANTLTPYAYADDDSVGRSDPAGMQDVDLDQDESPIVENAGNDPQGALEYIEDWAQGAQGSDQQAAVAYENLIADERIAAEDGSEPVPGVGGAAGDLSADELAQAIYEHVGAGDDPERPSLEEIERALATEPERIRDDALKFEADGVTVIVNETHPFRSTAYYPGG